MDGGSKIRMEKPNGDLTIVCISKGEIHAYGFIRLMWELKRILRAPLLLGYDGNDLPEYFEEYADEIVHLRSAGYIESVLTETIQQVKTKYVLRLDDDERVSVSLINWLCARLYQESDLFTFPRCNMWNDWQFITDDPLFPDLQTRLMIKDYALGWRADTIHEGCPNGTGKIVPQALIHDKFVVKSYQERFEIAEFYEVIREGGGMGFTYKPFQLPEDVYKEAHLHPLNDGYLPNWRTLKGKGVVWQEQQSPT